MTLLDFSLCIKIGSAFRITANTRVSWFPGVESILRMVIEMLTPILSCFDHHYRKVCASLAAYADFVVSATNAFTTSDLVCSLLPA